MGQVGDMRQRMAQNQLNDATNRWNFDQDAQWKNLQRYQQMVNPSQQWGTTTSQLTGEQKLVNPNNKPNAAMSIAGGALSGAAAGAAFGGWGAIPGAIIGAGLGYAGSR